MMPDRIFLDSFSGALAALKKGERTEANALAVLSKSPRVSTWDMSENRWLCGLVNDLKKNGLIDEVEEPYPWHRYVITDSGRAKMEQRTE